MGMKTKKLTRCAVLAALALALSYVEGFFPPLLGVLAETVSFAAAIYVIPAVLVLCTVVLFFCVRGAAGKA